MTTLKETVFIDRDNVVRLQLLEDGRPFATAYPDTTPTRWVLTFGAVTLDSDAVPTAFAWDAANSVLELNLGAQVADEMDFTAALLLVYAAEWPQGLVWLHPTCTPDKLTIRVCS